MIYVLSSSNFHTGGTTVLHQLAYKLNLLGIDAKMFYPNAKPNIDPVCEQYKKYNVPVAKMLTHNSIVIIPEIAIPNVKQLAELNVKCIIWWLSVNNATYSPEDITFAKENNILHLAQSQYALNFLRNNLNIPESNILYLSDYLDSTFFLTPPQSKVEVCERENIVLFNPIKGFESTCKLIYRSDHRIKWQALSGLTPSEMRDVMKKAKVYIDFGNHPGKDRIPREAAIQGCLILTNCEGAAANSIDVPIPAKYKFANDTHCNKILEVIYTLLEKYEEKKSDYIPYTETISKEYMEFEKDVFNIFTKLTNASVLHLETAEEYKSEILKKINSNDYISAYRALVEYRTLFIDESVDIDIMETVIRIGLFEYEEAQMCALRGLKKDEKNYELLLYLAETYMFIDNSIDITSYLDKAIQYSTGTPDEDVIKVMCKNIFNYEPNVIKTTNISK